jgi:peptidylprolyl isomerase
MIYLCIFELNFKEIPLKLLILLLTILTLALTACGGAATPAAPATEAPPPTSTPAPATPEPAAQAPAADTGAAPFELGSAAQTTASGLQYVIDVEGSGPSPQPGDLVQVHYVGKLADGTEFDNSYTRGEPIQFPIGQGMVIPGWDEGIALLTVGSKAKLVIPPSLAYGEQGAGGVIPPSATLYFEVELVDIPPGAPDSPTDVAEADFTTTESGLKYYDLEPGTGDVPKTGQTVVAHYTGWLEDGAKFDSSLDRGQPFRFALGQGMVIPGWDEGIGTMKVGGKRQLVIPPDLAYGEAGAGGVIPPNATLIFEVELLAATDN